MNKLKQVFAGDSHAYESSTQKNSSPRNSLDAKSKNDELAARLNGGNSSPRRSGSSATATDKVKEAIPTADQSSHAAQREQPIGSTSSRTGTTGLATGAAGAGATGAALGSHQGDNSYKTDAVRKNDELASGLHHGDRNSISDRSSRDLDNTSSNRHSLTGGHTTGDGPSTLGDRGSSIAGAGTGAGLVGANTGSHSHGIGHTHGNTGLTSDRVGSTTGDVYDQGSTGAATTASPPRLERTGTGRLGKKTSGKGFGTEPHSFGHVADSALHNFDHTKATHDHQHLQHVTHRDVRHVEVEEVLREREHDRHIHHVQHHVQPIIDRVEQDEVHHTNTVPITKVHERHTSTDEDRNLYMSLGANFKDTETHRPKERTIVDLGERVHENIHHHVHHVTQPIVEQEVIDRHRIHTVIPVHHVTHEAPIIHKSSIHESVPLDAFLSGGGKLDSQITAEKTGLLSSGECERSVDGVGAKLFSELGLRDNNGIFNHHSHSHGSTLPTSSSSHGEGYNTNSGLTSGSPSTGLLNKSAVPATTAAGGVAASSHDHSHSHHTHGDGLEHADHNYGKFGTTADPEATKEYR